MIGWPYKIQLSSYDDKYVYCKIKEDKESKESKKRRIKKDKRKRNKIIKFRKDHKNFNPVKKEKGDVFEVKLKDVDIEEYKSSGLQSTLIEKY